MPLPAGFFTRLTDLVLAALANVALSSAFVPDGDAAHADLQAVVEEALALLHCICDYPKAWVTPYCARVQSILQGEACAQQRVAGKLWPLISNISAETPHPGEERFER